MGLKKIQTQVILLLAKLNQAKTYKKTLELYSEIISVILSFNEIKRNLSENLEIISNITEQITNLRQVYKKKLKGFADGLYRKGSLSQTLPSDSIFKEPTTTIHLKPNHIIFSSELLSDPKKIDYQTSHRPSLAEELDAGEIHHTEKLNTGPTQEEPNYQDVPLRKPKTSSY